MKKKMGIALIIIGTLSIVFGIFLVSSEKNEAQEIGTLQESDLSEAQGSGDEASMAAFQQPTTGSSVAADLYYLESRHSEGGEPPVSESEKRVNTNTEHASGSTVSNGDISDVGNGQTTVGVRDEQDAKQKGNDFEGFMADVLKANNIRLKEWNQGTTSPDGAYAENELNPDFLVAHRDDKLEYWLECKYRSALSAKGFSLDEAQLGRYHKIQGRSKKKVLIALGVGGAAASPEKLYVIPIDTLVRFKFVGPKFLPSYSLNDPKANFKGHVKDWFYKEVFKRNKE